MENDKPKGNIFSRVFGKKQEVEEEIVNIKQNAGEIRKILINGNENEANQKEEENKKEEIINEKERNEMVPRSYLQ